MCKTGAGCIGEAKAKQTVWVPEQKELSVCGLPNTPCMLLYEQIKDLY